MWLSPLVINLCNWYSKHVQTWSFVSAFFIAGLHPVCYFVIIIYFTLAWNLKFYSNFFKEMLFAFWWNDNNSEIQWISLAHTQICQIRIFHELPLPIRTYHWLCLFSADGKEELVLNCCMKWDSHQPITTGSEGNADGQKMSIEYEILRETHAMFVEENFPFKFPTCLPSVTHWTWTCICLRKQ